MRKNLILLVLCLIIPFALFSVINLRHTSKKPIGSQASAAAATVSNKAIDYTAVYKNLNLEAAGLSQEAFTYAMKGYNNLLNEGKIKNQDYITIVDFSQDSRSKRFYLIDLKNGKIVMNTYVAHGRNSGLDKTEKFSNVPESAESSLGFYITKNVYSGKHGESLKIAGQEEGFNDNAEARAIVVHGADYVNAGRVNSGYMGRSLGCPALPVGQTAEAINYMKGGSVLFLYSPDENYLQNSSLLN
ncbi:MAG: hypothetical protein JWN76_2962 [Chitinophagaceae bacterium]|nr:hypothetical protein [Chitinophagaceae bacterium]